MNQPLLILALLAALSCCQAAPAQQSRDTTAAVQSTSGFSQLSVSNDHGTLMLLRGPDGTVTAWRDGVVLAPERVRHEGDHLRVVDEAGTTLFDIRMLPSGRLSYPYDAKVAATNVWSVADPDADWYDMSTPRKVIGVIVDAVDAVVASQLDLEPDSAFVISSVTPGMPAEKAGLQPHDVVVSIQGDSPATVDRLRDALHEKQPGDTITLELLRRGQRMEVECGVAEDTEPQFFSTGDFGPGIAAWAESLTDSVDASAYADLARSFSEEAYRQQAEMEEAREGLLELQDEYDSARANLERARADNASGDEESRADLKRLEIEVDMLHARLAEQQARIKSGAAAMQLLDLRGGGRALMVPPNSSAFGSTAPDPRLDGVDERLRSMDERMSRLEALLEKLVESDAAK